jgi:hypothetical protein
MNQVYAGIVLAIILFVVIVTIVQIMRMPRSEQLRKVQEWLLWAVTDAERAFGGGTGAIKLRSVYDLFVTRFPKLVNIITFDMFAALVDEALIKMRKMLETNKAVQDYVEGGNDNG